MRENKIRELMETTSLKFEIIPHILRYNLRDVVRNSPAFRDPSNIQNLCNVRDMLKIFSSYTILIRIFF